LKLWGNIGFHRIIRKIVYFQDLHLDFQNNKYYIATNSPLFLHGKVFKLTNEIRGIEKSSAGITVFCTGVLRILFDSDVEESLVQN